jgi:hypothetical protein
MRSPCFDCKLKSADKNGTECLKCDARVKYAQGLNVSLDPTIKIEKRSDDMGENKKGTCINCERVGLSLPGFGLCWACYDARRTALKNGTSVEEALVEVKYRINSGIVKKRRLKSRTSDIKKQKPEAWVELLEPPMPVTCKTEEPFGMIYLEFQGERDKELLSWLNEYSALGRRTLDQQILKILDAYMAFEKDRHASPESAL